MTDAMDFFVITYVVGAALIIRMVNIETNGRII